jgi:hypothetical protein
MERGQLMAVLKQNYCAVFSAANGNFEKYANVVGGKICSYMCENMRNFSILKKTEAKVKQYKVRHKTFEFSFL